MSLKEVCIAFSYTLVAKSWRSKSKSLDSLDRVPARQLNIEAESVLPHSDEESSLTCWKIFREDDCDSSAFCSEIALL